MPSLSVITLTCNRLARIERCLARLLPQLEPGDEVVLIDNGSTDGTREHFRTQPYPRVRFFERDALGSWAEARNFAVARAQGDLIAFLDDDCLPAEDWVARGRAALAGADAVGGMVRAHGIHLFPSWWHPSMGWMVGLSVPGHAGPDAGRVHYPMTCNLFVRAEACRAVPFQEIGGRLDGHGTVNYLAGREDAQWWWALRTGGYRTRFDPELSVGHAIDPTRLKLEYLRDRARNDGRAWAAREGRTDDYIETAYAWWDQLVRQWGAWGLGPGERAPHREFYRLCRERQGAALRGLSAGRREPALRDAPGLHARFWRAGARWAGDRGRTLVRGLIRSWLRPLPEQADEWPIERLAVIAFGYLGDLVILQGVLRGLAAAYPRMTVHVLAPPAGTLALRGVARVVVSTPGAVDPASGAAPGWLASWLRDVQPDAIVAPYLHGPWGRVLTKLRHTPRPVAGFDHDSGLGHQRQIERIALRIHKNLKHHEVENLRALMAAVGLECGPEPPLLEPEAGAAARVAGEAILATSAMGRPPLVLFNPDAGHPQKEWTEAGWAELLRQVLDATDWRVAINASRPRPELEAAVEGLSPAGRVHWLRGVTLEELVAWMAQSAAVVTVDAGPQHLAHALGVPSVTLYGPMDERRWRDWWARPIHRTLRGCTWDLTPAERRPLAENHQTALIGADAVYSELMGVMGKSELDVGETAPRKALSEM